MTTQTKLRAFHGDKKVKEKYIARVKAHAEADEIIKGKYWQGGKGCAVGCTVHSDSHRSYETELGIPRVIARLEDRIFEGMSNDQAKDFPLKFLEAINVGADLSLVWYKFLVWLLDDPTEGVGRYIKREKPAFDKAVANYKKIIEGESISLAEWIEIRDESWRERNAAHAATAAADATADAYAAAHAADAATYAAHADAAAAHAADAYAAAHAAHAYVAAAYAAAAHAVHANAAISKSFNRQAEKLLEILKETK